MHFLAAANTRGRSKVRNDRRAPRAGGYQAFTIVERGADAAQGRKRSTYDDLVPFLEINGARAPPAVHFPGKMVGGRRTRPVIAEK